jgi:glycine oxidase
MKIGIAGAGLVGRLAAWTLAHQGHEVHVFDPASSAAPSFDGQGAAGFTAAGMLSPTAERDTAEPDVADLGWHSIERWEAITTALSQGRDVPPLFARRGSLMVAHGSDAGAARRVLARIEGDVPTSVDQAQLDRAPQALSHEALQALEPALHSASGPLHAWLLPGEAHIDTTRTLGRLHDDAPQVQWHWGSLATEIKPGHLNVQPQGATHQVLGFDWVIDARGVGAKDACAVRGVRGEVIWLHAPGVDLQRPVRLLHPRYRVYIVPRPGDVILIGASEIESEDRSNVSLRSAVELMAAAHSVVPGLAEARIVRLDANLRPALPDHRPQCHVEPGLIRINGLYRHGWLLAPALLDEALQQAQLNPSAS